MNFLPDVLQLGTFPVDIRTIAGVLGLLLAYGLVGVRWFSGAAARPEAGQPETPPGDGKAEAGQSAAPAAGGKVQATSTVDAARDLILNLALGGILGAKLIDIVLNPSGYIANPVTLLIFPFGPLALEAGLVSGAIAVLLGLRSRSDRLAVVDRSAVPLAFGLTVAAAGFRGPGSQAFAPVLLIAAVAAMATGRQAQRPGDRAAITTVMAACALVLADIAHPGSGMVGGVSGLQIAAAVAGTGAWLWTRRRSA